MSTTWIRTDVIPEDDYRQDPGAYGAAQYPLLAEGDSWFSTNGQPAQNLLKSISLPGTSFIVSFAYPGDEIRKMAKLAKRGYLRVLLKDPNKYWRCMLLSGGGNDLISDARKIIRHAPAGASATDPDSYIDANELDGTLSSVIEGYRRIASLRDGTVNARMPILAHTYDYAMPRNAPAKFFGFANGPWLLPALRKAEVPDGMGPMVVDKMFSALAETIKGLARPRSKNGIKDFFVIDTRGVLTPADPASTGRSNDWLNEIHPTGSGYEKLARQRVNAALSSLL